MNPASKEYGGRSKLPHNLKQLFRDVAMSAPDIVLISEVILRSEGAHYAEVLAQKVVDVFECSRQLLSPQRHYDWGLRALKTVLRHAGQMLRQPSTSDQQRTMEAEMQIVIHALKINTLSKLTFSDSQRFVALLTDVFPGVVAEDQVNQSLIQQVTTSCQQLGYEVMPNQIQKVLQLYGALQQRMGVVLVGPSCSGRSQLLHSCSLHIYVKQLLTTHVLITCHYLQVKALSYASSFTPFKTNNNAHYSNTHSIPSRWIVHNCSAG